ncbi:hypothetical protein D6T63_15625 [Arthrobacter cheniae]|uniref:DUF3800 domain-containing protein n=1 Tax=Arthrobacter cheniae TaxID=1258888 RepID=A0A3A5M3M7_9MICC|nr:hypothetical protein D6T63_15625 [Arthrobacter cheniae]
MSRYLPRRSHVFVDESKAGRYYIAAAVISPADVVATRSAIKSLRHKGSSAVHFKSERDAVRKAFLRGAALTGVKTVVYIVDGKPDKVARPACLEALIQDLCEAEAERFVLEQDDSLAATDRRIIHAELKAHGNTELEYRHMRRTEEPLLWVGDAVAWCFQKGGSWRAEVEPLIGEVRRL